MYGEDGVIVAKTKNKGSKYTEDWLPIKAISNGMITLDDDEKVTGVKIIPRNIFILSVEQQDNVMISLKNFYNTIDYEFWIICADRPVDISIYLSQLQMLYNNTQSQMTRKLVLEDINKANMFMNNNVVDTEYYLLFKEKNMETIQKRLRLLINNLGICGLNAMQTSNDDLRIIIENFLNGGMNTEFGVVMPE